MRILICDDDSSFANKLSEQVRIQLAGFGHSIIGSCFMAVL